MVEAELARAFACSRTPAREAILRLADEGLITIFPQAGTFVAPIPVDELPEAILLRRALEEAVAREAAQRADDAAVALLRSQVARQRRLEAAADHEGFHGADEEFHATLAAIADRRRFWQAVLQSKLQVDRFRRLTLPRAGRMGAVAAEHERIVDAIAAKDADRAASALGQHLDALLEAIDAARAAHPAMFTPRFRAKTSLTGGR